MFDMKRFGLLLLTCSVCAMYSVQASEGESEHKAKDGKEQPNREQDEKDYALGSRRLSEVEEMEIQERRASEMPEELEKKVLPLANSPLMMFGAKPAKNESSASKSLAIFYQFDDPAYLSRIHPLAYYYPKGFSLSGEKIELNDGSIWYIHPAYRMTTRQWAANDPVFIKPNVSFFSSYRYVLQNRVTGDIAEVNLFAPPMFVGPYTHWIVNIDYYNGIVYLNDGTIWNIGAADNASLLKGWMIGDRIIIGVNHKWRFDFYPHILINVQTLNYCEGNFIY